MGKRNIKNSGRLLKLHHNFHDMYWYYSYVPGTCTRTSINTWYWFKRPAVPVTRIASGPLCYELPGIRVLHQCQYFTQVLRCDCASPLTRQYSPIYPLPGSRHVMADV